MQLLPTAKVSKNVSKIYFQMVFAILPMAKVEEKCQKFILKSFLLLLRRQRFQAIIADGKDFKKYVKNLFSNRIRNIADGKGLKKSVNNLFLNCFCNYCRRQRFQKMCQKFIFKSYLQLLPAAKVSIN
jgi:hypothetical protein